MTIDLGRGTAITARGTDELHSVEHVVGTGFDDTLVGSEGYNRMFGGRGHDVVSGRGGGDRIFGWSGNDILRGGDGTDVVDGEGGNDLCRGETIHNCEN